jgi:hypothetical protein
VPVMPRLRGKATKIAWAILGKPLAMDKPHKSEKQSKIEKQLVFEETTRVR